MPARSIGFRSAVSRSRGRATLYYDEIRTPHYTDCLNELCETMLANDLGGLFHAGGPRPMTTLYNIAQVINRVGGYAPECLMGCMRVEAGPIPPRAGNVSMDCSKLVAAALGHATPSIPGRSTKRSCRRIPSGTTSVATSPAPSSCFHACSTAIRAGGGAISFRQVCDRENACGRRTC